MADKFNTASKFLIFDINTFLISLKVCSFQASKTVTTHMKLLTVLTVCQHETRLGWHQHKNICINLERHFINMVMQL